MVVSLCGLVGALPAWLVGLSGVGMLSKSISGGRTVFSRGFELEDMPSVSRDFVNNKRRLLRIETVHFVCCLFCHPIFLHNFSFFCPFLSFVVFLFVSRVQFFQLLWNSHWIRMKKLVMNPHKRAPVLNLNIYTGVLHFPCHVVQNIQSEVWLDSTEPTTVWKYKKAMQVYIPNCNKGVTILPVEDLDQPPVVAAQLTIYFRIEQQKTHQKLRHQAAPTSWLRRSTQPLQPVVHVCNTF